MGLPDVEPDVVQKLDAIDGIDDLSRVGRKLAEEVALAHFGIFVEK